MKPWKGDRVSWTLLNDVTPLGFVLVVLLFGCYKMPAHCGYFGRKIVSDITFSSIQVPILPDLLAKYGKDVKK